MQVRPYLYFDGRCEEAIEFYKLAIDAKVQMLMRFGQSPVPIPPEKLAPGSENKVMHATLLIGNSVVNVSDGPNRGNASFTGIALTLTASDSDEADHLFTGLSNGGKVNMPLEKTFFSPGFGMCTDRFGVSWMVIVEPS